MKTKNPQDIIKTLKLEENNGEHEHQLYNDHYHGEIHYDRHGNVDQITENEFSVKSYFHFSRRNLTFKLSAAGIILALSVAVSALDILFESFLLIPIGQVYISFRFLDTIVLLLGLPLLGPVFGSLVGILEPVFHNLIHGMEHGWIQPLTDSLTNFTLIWLTWALYYIVFQNSPFHRNPNKSKDRLKRFAPTSILIVLGGTTATITFILALYIQSKTGIAGNHVFHEEHHHEGVIDWHDLTQGKVAIMVLGLWGLNLFRYAIGYAFFSILEVRLRPLNHRYR